MYLITCMLMMKLMFSDVLASKGCVQLDTYSFDKVINKFEASLIKFDSMYPYGDKHEAFEAVCEASYSSPDLIVGEVQVRDYGDKENEDLAKRFGLEGKDSFPSVKLFIKGQKDPITFTPNTDADFTTNNLKRFLRSKSDVYIGLPGCLQTFDKLASQFIKESPEKRKSILKEAEKLWDTAKGHRENKSAETYVKIMRKLIEKGDEFIKSESTRVENVLKGKLSDEKQTQMQERLNILQSFTVASHDEL